MKTTFLRSVIVSALLFANAIVLVASLYMLQGRGPAGLIDRIISRIGQQFSNNRPESYLVPTPLPLSEDDAADLDNALDQLLGADRHNSDQRIEIAKVGTYKPNQSTTAGETNARNERAGFSEFAILAATSTPAPLTTTSLTTTSLTTTSLTTAPAAAEPLFSGPYSLSVPNTVSQLADQLSDRPILPQPEQNLAPLASNASTSGLAVIEPLVTEPLVTEPLGSESASAEAQNALDTIEFQSRRFVFPVRRAQALGHLAVQTSRSPAYHGDGRAYNRPDIRNRASSGHNAPSYSVADEPSRQDVAAQPKPIAPAVALTNFNHEWQTWNNCGPATLAMNLSYFGSTLNQADIKAALRQNDDDKNVSPDEMVAFAKAQGFHAQRRVNGSSTLLKTLLSNGIPVLIETWMEPDPNDGMGHYRLLTGYNDEAQQWTAFDSYVSHDFVRDGTNYEGVLLPYAEAEQMWQVFNRTYLLIYTDAQADLIHAIYGAQLDLGSMRRQALADNWAEARDESLNPYAWFNLGTSLNALGNYTEAATSFDRARQLGLPWRMLWYQFGPFEAYYNTGRYDEVLALAYATIATTESVEELFYWKGQGLAATGNPNSASKAWQQALTLNPSFHQARQALGVASP